jgi:hypothetical protein
VDHHDREGGPAMSEDAKLQRDADNAYDAMSLAEVKLRDLQEVARKAVQAVNAQRKLVKQLGRTWLDLQEQLAAQSNPSSRP